MVLVAERLSWVPAFAGTSGCGGVDELAEWGMQGH
jgi:hypothetical protein